MATAIVNLEAVNVNAANPDHLIENLKRYIGHVMTGLANGSTALPATYAQLAQDAIAEYEAAVNAELDRQAAIATGAISLAHVFNDAEFWAA